MWMRIGAVHKLRPAGRYLRSPLATTQLKTLFHLPWMGVRVKYSKYVDPDIVAEREEYHRKLTEYRKWNKAEFERYKDAENKNWFNPNLNEESEVQRMLDTHRLNLTKERTSIIKVAMHTKNQIMHLKKRDIERQEKNRWHAAKDMQTLRERQMYLQALQIDHSAPTPPPTIIDHTAYYERLQSLAFLSREGNHEEVERLLRNEEIVDEKNVYLKPIYRNLKHSIRYITKTEEAQLTKKFKQKMAGVIHSGIENPQPQLEKLKKEFEQQLREMRDREKDPKLMVKKLERHITSLFHFLMNWVQYVDIIYSSETVIQQMKYFRLNQSEAEKIDSEYEKEYLNKILKEERKEEEAKYETVEEGITTDTAESADEDPFELKHDSDQDTNKDAAEPGFAEEGILGQLFAEEQQHLDSENSIVNFEHENTPNLDQERKSEISVDYGIGPSDVDSFKIKIQAKGQIKKDVHSPNDNILDEDQDFVVSNLDMFGIKGDDEDAARFRQTTEQEQFIQDQITEIMDKLGNEYNEEKAEFAPHSNIDPYNPPNAFTETITQTEMEGRYSTSIVLETFYEKLKALPDSELSNQQVKTKERLVGLLDYMSRIKIMDGPVLSEIYELYRYKI